MMDGWHEVCLTEPLAGGELLAAGGMVSVLPDATIAEDVTLSGGKLVFNGTAEGDLMVYGEEVEVHGTVRGDIGGFGLESDFTAKTAVGVMYNITDSILLDVQYVGLWVDYETGTRDTASYFAYDTVTHGPVIGLIFKF